MSWTACKCGMLIDTDDAPHLYDEDAETWQCEACDLANDGQFEDPRMADCEPNEG